MHNKSGNGFQLKGQSEEFTARQNDLFNVLDVLENKTSKKINHSSTESKSKKLEEAETNQSRNVTTNLNRYLEEVKQTTYVDFKKSKKSDETKSLRGKESIFKRPEAPISKCLPLGRVPDFRKNPQKWTKYSLNDVEEMSDRSNKAAAMSFLNELQSRKRARNNRDTDIDSQDDQKKIIFNKTVLIKDTASYDREEGNSVEEIEEERASFRSSKVIMPEYVIGQKKHTKSNKKDNKIERNLAAKQLKLDHLIEEEDVEDDDN